MGAMTNPSPCCPSVPTLLSTLSAAGGVSSTSAHGAHPSSGVTPIEDGGHGLWVPLSPPDPPELRPQRESLKTRLLPPQAVQRSRECLQPAGPWHGDLGRLNHGPRPVCSGAWGAAHVLGSAGAQSHGSAIGTEGLAVLTAPAAWAPSGGSMPGDRVPWDPQAQPRAGTSPVDPQFPMFHLSHSLL